MIRRSIIPGLILAVLVISAGAGAYAASLSPVARVARAEGGVTVNYPGTDSFVSVWRHEKVGAGDTIDPGADGTTEIAFADGTRLVLGPASTLGITAAAPRRIEGGTGGRVVLDISVRLFYGTVRAAAPAGGVFLLSPGAGTSTVAAAPKTGADISAAMGVFAWGEYVSVRTGCAFVAGPGAKPVALCAVGETPYGLRLGRGVPTPGYESLADLAFSGKPPVIETGMEPINEITVDGRPLLPEADGAFHLPGAGRGVTIEGTAGPGSVVVISGEGGALPETVTPGGDGRWQYRVGPAPGDGYALEIGTVNVGEPPAGLEAAVTKGTRPAPEEESDEVEVNPEAVASRFVRDFTAALARGDSGALSALISPDYSGTAGGGGRSALIRGVSDFFRAGGTLSVSAYATGASFVDGSVIATMSFTSRVSGTPKSGNLRIWLTADGVLIHAEGQWVL